MALLQSSCVLNNVLEADSSAMVGDLPANWTGGDSAIPSAAVTGWVTDFRSARLTELVRTAVDNNYSLASARERVFEAQERARIVGSNRVPALDGRLGASRAENPGGNHSNSFSFSLNLSWELDLWGRVKNLRDSQWDLVTAESNVYEASRLSLAANVTRVALEIVESREQTRVIRRNLKSLRTNLDILDSKLEAGDADTGTALDISLSRSDVASAESSLLAEQRQMDAAKRILETLLGRYPAGKIDSLHELPNIPRKVPAGLPSELLLRRPDLLAAEARVDSALKELAASRKALLPTVGLTASTGSLVSDDFGDLFDGQNLIWSIGQNVTRPIYQGGRLKAEIQLDEHRRDELIATYAETALTAFREVESTLAAEAYFQGQVAALKRAVTEARRAEGLALSQYEEGLVDIITVLNSQRRAFTAESSLLAVKLALLQNRVDLYLALGGDFDHSLIEK